MRKRYACNATCSLAAIMTIPIGIYIDSQCVIDTAPVEPRDSTNMTYRNVAITVQTRLLQNHWLQNKQLVSEMTIYDVKSGLL
jgi:hypothetical protein